MLTAVVPMVVVLYGVCAGGLGAGVVTLVPEPARLTLTTLLPLKTVTSREDPLVLPTLWSVAPDGGTTRTEYVPADSRANLYEPFDPVVKTCSLVSRRPFLLLSM